MRASLPFLTSFLLVSLAAAAQDLPLGLGAGPRLDAAAYEATAATEDALRRLGECGYDVVSMGSTSAILSAAPAEATALASAGYTLTPLGSPKSLPAGYRTIAQIEQDLAQFASGYPGLCRLESIGASVQGRTLWALRITDNPDIEEAEPEFKYVSAIHGDEAIGTELCLRFAALLLESYGTDARLTALVDETDIWIVPLMNPDGYAVPQRRNANGFDLNRAFPAWPAEFHGMLGDGVPPNLEGRQPEVAALMAWSAAHRFVLSANFHTGALVFNYPYDDDGKGSVFSPSPDEDLFVALALEYASRNPPMHASSRFANGITNGAAWYSIDGGMQDWNYRYAGCCAATIELSDSFVPPASEFDAYWDDNCEAMIAYAEAVHWGIHGVVTDACTGAPIQATVLLNGNPQPVFTDPSAGDFHRLTLPGAYDLTITAEGYLPLAVEGVAVGQDAPAHIELAMTPETPPAMPPGNMPLLVFTLGAALVLAMAHGPAAAGRSIQGENPSCWQAGKQAKETERRRTS